MRPRLALLLVALALSAAAAPFEQMVLDAHGEGLGSTVTGIDATPGAALANPALLGLLPRSGAQFLVHDWYGSGIRSMTAGWAQRTGFGGLAASWHRYGIADLWTEDQISLAVASRFHWRGRPASLGLRLRALAADAPGYEGADARGASWGGSGDLALVVQPTRFLKCSLMSAGLWRSELQFLEDGGRWPAAPRDTRLGLSYFWRRDLSLVLEYRTRPGRDPELLFGAEVRFFDAFHVLAGSGGDFATAGFSLRADRWHLDFAFQSRGRLGNNLTLSFSPLLAAQEDGP